MADLYDVNDIVGIRMTEIQLPTYTPPMGYPCTVLAYIKAQYLCGICNQVIRTPIQGHCGHK